MANSTSQKKEKTMWLVCRMEEIADDLGIVVKDIYKSKKSALNDDLVKEFGGFIIPAIYAKD